MLLSLPKFKKTGAVTLLTCIHIDSITFLLSTYYLHNIEETEMSTGKIICQDYCKQIVRTW